MYSLSEYDGLIGKYSFDLNGDVVGVNLILKKIKDGHVEIFKVEEVVNQSLIKAETLRKSILKSAFEGKLVKTEEVKQKVTKLYLK